MKDKAAVNFVMYGILPYYTLLREQKDCQSIY